MATGTIQLPIGAAAMPDGTTSNLGPGITRRKSSATAPGPYWLEAAFDASNDEWLVWHFVMPADYSSSPVMKVNYKMASATANDVMIDGRLAAITSGDSTDGDAKAFGSANTTTQTVAGTAGYEKTISLTLTNADSVAAGDDVSAYLARVGSNGSDTATGDMEVTMVWIEYTTT